jgi:Tol biopolymer transport system component
MKSNLWIAARRIVFVFAAFLWCLSPRGLLGQFPPTSSEPDIVERDPRAAAEREALLLSGTRQLTFEGRRAGEGYFSADGRRMIFQSEREPDNPFFQIYVMDFDTGDIQRVSPGYGKTTCAWIHPDGQHVLFASTHEDAQAQDRQREEFELRESGRQRRYSWDYDKHYEIYRHRLGTDHFENLTQTLGYDAEGSWSPDGQLIAFASNRRAYTDEMTEAERETFELNPSAMIDIYLMDADGGQARRLTDSPGYDGGPFFSPDGQRICWRRFSVDGSIAEIWTMGLDAGLDGGLDGEEARQLTRMGVMSWAPFYHPSGEYLIFTTLAPTITRRGWPPCWKSRPTSAA